MSVFNKDCKISLLYINSSLQEQNQAKELFLISGQRKIVKMLKVELLRAVVFQTLEVSSQLLWGAIYSTKPS